MLSRNQIPRGSAARQPWGRLSKSIRKSVIKEARRGRGYPDSKVAALAVGWSWEVLGPPWARDKAGFVAQIVDFVDAAMLGAGNLYRGDVLDGREQNDNNLYVRYVARRIEKANPVLLEDEQT